ncbi:MAG: hypothetical protein WCP79_07405 [Bacillota bacterium]
MKKLFVIVIALMLLTSAAYAAPLMDYSFGRATFDFGVNYSPSQNMPTENQTMANSGMSGGWNLDFGATAGLGNNFAVKYSQQNMSNASVTNNNETATLVAQVQQVNLMYDFMPSGAPFNVSAFIGAQYSNFGFAASGQPSLNATGLQSFNKWGGQIGVIASTYVADSVIVYGQAQYGLPYYQFGGGLAYAVTPNFDVNLSANYVSSSLSSFVNLNGSQNANIFSIPITLGVTMKI